MSSPLSQADIESKRAEVESLEASVKKLKEDRLASEDTLKAAEAQRSKEHRRYVEEHQEDAEARASARRKGPARASQVVTSISQASQALKGGKGAAQAMAKAMRRCPRAVAGRQDEAFSLSLKSMAQDVAGCGAQQSTGSLREAADHVLGRQLGAGTVDSF